MPQPPIAVRPDAIAYRDSSEDFLLDFFSKHQDLDEYGLYPKDAPWPIHYHLTPRRKSLLNWLDLGRGGSILELGAGCGALTAHLVTLPHRVTAVEGSPTRAEIIRRRLPRAENLSIVAGNAANLPFEKAFDVVTLIGVLEYALAFVDHPLPHEHLLARARRYLADDGCLVLAIENRLGHKYLAGLPEDHTGRPYSGVNGYPGPGAARTFDRPTLAAMLARAGFPAQAWFYPSPDYKTPDAVLAEAAFATDGFDPLPLLDLPSRDYDGRHAPAFNERLFLRGVLAGGAAQQFMNSFLVLAAATPDAPALAANARVLAVSVNADGCPPAFQTMTRFEVRDDRSVVVRRANLHGLAPAAFSSGRQHLKPAETYLLGYVSVLETVLERTMAQDPAGAATALTAWMDSLAARARQPGPDTARAFAAFCDRHLGRRVYQDHLAGPWLSGALVDAHPGNVLVHPATGDVRYIDLEWRLSADVPLQLVVDRGINHVGQKLAAWRPYLADADTPARGLPASLERRLGRHPLFRRADVASLAAFDAWLLAAVAHADLDHRLPSAPHPNPEPPEASP